MSTFRRIVTASLIVAAGAALSACDSDMVGAAAVVGDDRFTVSDLQDQVEQVEGLDGFDLEGVGGTSVLQRELLSRHIQHQIFLQLADQEDLDVSEADVDNKIDEYRAQAPDGDLDALLARSAYTDTTFRAGVRDQLTAQAYADANKVDQDGLTKVLNEVGDSVGVEVNPRYGTWGEDVSVTDDSGSISKSLDEPTDAASDAPAAPPAQ